MLKAILVALIVALGATAALADTRQDCEQSEDHDLRIRACSDLIAGDPKAAWAYANRGLAYLSKRDYDRAIADGTKAIELAPKDSRDVPEKRRITQLMFPDRAAAEKAYAELSKAKDFDAAASKLGFSATDTQLGLLTQRDVIDPRIGEAAFKLRKNELSRPVKGQYAVALLRVSDIEVGKEGLPGAYAIRGLAYAGKGDHDRAIAAFRWALELDPDHRRSRDALLQRCRIVALAHDERISSCTAIIGSAGETVANRADAHGSRGVAYFMKGDHDRAIADFSAAIGLEPDEPDAYHQRGHVYVAKGDLDRALADFTKAIEIYPRDAPAYASRGLAYSAKGDRDRARADYARAIEIDPGVADAYYNSGIAYSGKGDYDRAIAEYTKAIEIDPGRADVYNTRARLAEAYNNRGSAYVHKGDHDRAVVDFTKAIEISPRYFEAYYKRGTVYSRKGDHDRAIADYSKAIELNPRLPEAYYNRATAYSRKGNHDRAIADLTKAIEINPQDARYYTDRGLAYDSRGDYDRAIADFTRVLGMSLLLTSADTYYNRGIAYRHKGDYNRAIADLTAAIGINPNDAEYYLSRGIAYARRGDHSRAIADYSQAIGMNLLTQRDWLADAYYNRGVAYYRRGDRSLAIADFRQALTVNPYHEHSRDALSRLGVAPPPRPQPRLTPY